MANKHRRNLVNRDAGDIPFTPPMHWASILYITDSPLLYHEKNIIGAPYIELYKRDTGQTGCGKTETLANNYTDNNIVLCYTNKAVQNIRASLSKNGKSATPSTCSFGRVTSATTPRWKIQLIHVDEFSMAHNMSYHHILLVVVLCYGLAVFHFPYSLFVVWLSLKFNISK